MTPTLLFTVEDAFVLAKIGLVLTPGHDGKRIVPNGTPITLEFPDGSCHATSISGTCMSTPNPKGTFPISLPEDWKQRSIPPGTKVWLETPS